jgi:Ca-activated chloride channel homolog
VKRLAQQHLSNSDAQCHQGFAGLALTSTTLAAWLVLILPAIGLGSVNAQESPTIKLNTNLVTVNVSVTDSKGRPLGGLAAGDFVVLEDGRPVGVEFFSASGPASIVFVLDISSSMVGNVQSVRNAFRQFLRSAHQDNDYSLITFNASARLVVRSVGADELWQILSTIEPFGDTALYDAILLGLQTLDQMPQQHRALVVLSDGEDNRSQSSISAVGQAVSVRHATVYTVGILSSSKGLIDDWRRGRLAQLADASGGLLRLVAPNEIARALADISSDVRNQYSLGYYASDGLPGWRHLHVSLVSTQQRHNLRYKERYLTR